MEVAGVLAGALGGEAGQTQVQLWSWPSVRL